ncbi:hypothetical protein [Comamonas testosteroni]|uniref:hypothetical protein n=1 Tax=Comamonas testosteroni TaxID=285 RepID=UPI003F5D1A67
MPSVVMVAMGGLVVHVQRPHQHARFAQHAEQCIAPDLDSRLIKRQLEQVQQFAHANAWLMTPLFADHRFVLFAACMQAGQALVVRLTADPHVAASPRHAQPLDEPLREDLPKAFLRRALHSPS